MIADALSVSGGSKRRGDARREREKRREEKEFSILAPHFSCQYFSLKNSNECLLFIFY